MGKAKIIEGLPEQPREYNSLVVNRIAEKFGVTVQFVRSCLRGDRHSETATTICKEYKTMALAVENALNGSSK